MKKYIYFILTLVLPLNIHAENALELAPMVITSSNISQYDHSDLHEIELPDLNGLLRQESSITLNQGSGQMASNLSFRGAGGQGMLTLDGGVPILTGRKRTLRNFSQI